MKLSLYINLPNLISIIRLLFSPLILLLPEKGIPLLFFILALSDALDGFLARKLKLQTELGKVLDPLADKVMILCGLFVCVFKLKTLPDLVLFLTLSRDFYLLIGSSFFILKRRKVPQARFFGKAFTFSLSLLIILCMLKISIPWLIWLVFLFLFLSWVDYTLAGIKRLRNQTFS